MPHSEPSPVRLALARRALQRGEVVACPTEAVWGLHANPWNTDAVQRILQLKARAPSKGVIVIAANVAQLEPFIDPPSRKALLRATATWPGPHTWVFPATAFCPPWVTGGRDTVAVRVTAHRPIAALCEAFGGALVSTSANRSGKPPARSVSQVRLVFGPDLVVLPGPTGGLARPTPIREVSTGHLLRR